MKTDLKRWARSCPARRQL